MAAPSARPMATEGWPLSMSRGEICLPRGIGASSVRGASGRAAGAAWDDELTVPTVTRPPVTDRTVHDGLPVTVGGGGSPPVTDAPYSWPWICRQLTGWTTTTALAHWAR